MIGLKEDLVVRELNVSRGGRTLISNLSLDLPPSSVLGISGPSGSGKTTLLRTLAGLDDRYSGSVERPDGRLAMVFQEPRLLPWARALENVTLVGADTATATKWLERTGLGDFLNHYPATMSGGMRQRAAIARAMATAPRILLVDEPFSSLDPELATQLRSMLLEIIHDSDLICIWVTHNMAELAEVSTERLHLTGLDGAVTHPSLP